MKRLIFWEGTFNCPPDSPNGISNSHHEFQLFMKANDQQLLGPVVTPIHRFLV